MARTVLVAGTASHVGKSTIAAGLCRSMARAAVAVAPFKGQNMSNNARVAPTPAGEWGEIGVSQFVQARAAGIAPTTDVNPVLLKPRGDGESQLIVDGRGVANVAAVAYYEEHWTRALEAVEEAHARLAAEHDAIVAEGAGSIAEINLHHRDLANVETARIAEADVLLVVDIERGGAFASLYGTLELMPPALRERTVGAIINKFRGDPSLLADGIEEIEERTGVPILGVVPFDDPGLPAEDSVALPAVDEPAVIGDDDGVEAADAVTVAVPRLPHIANATDLEPLAGMPGVRVRYVPPAGELRGADAVVIPGSKNTVDDLLALREAGFETELRAFDGPVVGVCAGYQMLGERLTNARVESTADVESVAGFGLLPVETRFTPHKRVERVTMSIEGAGPLAGISGSVEGYEIHLGRTSVPDELDRPLGPQSAATDRVLGTYVHGLFENESVRIGFIDRIRERTGKPRPPVPGGTDPWAFDAAADLVEEHVDLSALGAPFDAAVE